MTLISSIQIQSINDFHRIFRFLAIKSTESTEHKNNEDDIYSIRPNVHTNFCPNYRFKDLKRPIWIQKLSLIAFEKLRRRLIPAGVIAVFSKPRILPDSSNIQNMRIAVPGKLTGKCWGVACNMLLTGT